MTLSTCGNRGGVASKLPKVTHQCHPHHAPLPLCLSPTGIFPFPYTPLHASGSLHLLFTLLEHSFPRGNTAHSLTSFRSLSQRSSGDT